MSATFSTQKSISEVLDCSLESHLTKISRSQSFFILITQFLGLHKAEKSSGQRAQHDTGTTKELLRQDTRGLSLPSSLKWVETIQAEIVIQFLLLCFNPKPNLPVSPDTGWVITSPSAHSPHLLYRETGIMDVSTKTRVSLTSTIHTNFSPSSLPPCAKTSSVIAGYRERDLCCNSQAPVLCSSFMWLSH